MKTNNKPIITDLNSITNENLPLAYGVDEYGITQKVKDQFLKDIESVLLKHILEPYDFNTCSCGFDCVLPFNCDKSKDQLICYVEHLIQEIKNAMEKERKC